MLWLMMGRVDGAEADLAGKLENCRHALATGTRKALGGKDRRDLLSRIFELEDRFGLFADALRTYALLQKERDHSAKIAEFGPRAAQKTAAMKSDEVIKTSATIYNPCDCEKGEPLWHYRPSRRTFSFANLNGNVNRFKARCETMRIRDAVAGGKSWTLASDWGSCRVFVFGDDGARFDFLERRNASDNETTGQAAVARNHVLD